MSETRLWQKLKHALGDHHAQRHENKFPPGIPDVHYVINDVAGWIELKYRDAYPRRSPLKILDPLQYIWHTKYQKAGGKSFTLIQVEDDYFLSADPMKFAEGRIHLRRICIQLNSIDASILRHLS